MGAGGHYRMRSRSLDWKTLTRTPCHFKAPERLILKWWNMLVNKCENNSYMFSNEAGQQGDQLIHHCPACGELPRNLKCNWLWWYCWGLQGISFYLKHRPQKFIFISSASPLKSFKVYFVKRASCLCRCMLTSKAVTAFSPPHLVSSTVAPGCLLISVSCCNTGTSIPESILDKHHINTRCYKYYKQLTIGRSLKEECMYHCFPRAGEWQITICAFCLATVHDYLYALFLHKFTKITQSFKNQLFINFKAVRCMNVFLTPGFFTLSCNLSCIHAAEHFQQHTGHTFKQPQFIEKQSKKIIYAYRVFLSEWGDVSYP